MRERVLLMLTAFSLVIYLAVDFIFQIHPRYRPQNLLTGKKIIHDDRMNARGIVIHHSATPIRTNSGTLIDADFINDMHRVRGFRRFKFGRTYNIGYHYVILYDGRVQMGRPESYPGAHVMGRPNYYNLGICLVGFFSRQFTHDGHYRINRPTPEQLSELHRLIYRLQVQYAISVGQVRRHCDFQPRQNCPGDKFPWQSFIDTHKENLTHYVMPNPS